MDEIKLLGQCRYYSGEAECPFADNPLRLYWDTERFYVLDRGVLDEQIDGYYRNAGGKDYSGIPRALLILMFNYWGKGVYDLKKWVADGGFYKMVDDYLEIASDHFPKDKIPHNYLCDNTGLSAPFVHCN